MAAPWVLSDKNDRALKGHTIRMSLLSVNLCNSNKHFKHGDTEIPNLQKVTKEGGGQTKSELIGLEFGVSKKSDQRAHAHREQNKSANAEVT